MLLHLNSIDYLTLTSEFLVLGLRLRRDIELLLFLFIVRNDWQHELEVTPVQLKINKFVNHLTYLLAVALHQDLYLQLLDVWQPELLEVAQQFTERGFVVAFEVAEVYKDSLFLALKAGMVSNQITPSRDAQSTYLLFVETHQPIGHVVQHMDSNLFVLLIHWRVSEVHSTDALVLPTSAEGILVVE